MKINSSPSDPLKNAILTALEEENRSQGLRFLKTIIFTLLLAGLLVGGLYALWSSEYDSIILGAGVSLIAVFASGFLFCFYPQPRVVVPGFWMPWMWGRLLILMGIISTVQIILCPDLAGVFGIEAILPQLSHITHFFMNIGGMKLCMFACGILFSGISATLAFLSLRKVLFRTRMTGILTASGFVFLGQLPVIICQAMVQPSYLVFWIAGSVIAIVLSGLAIRTLEKSYF